ncbi:hypothetical protein H5410_022608 [Solanum commersonii]|uniref:Uncharacterized protein n=1 Tax=Solanum commersonii TaxID=4109 RepID=A0A9J5ZHA0_SOLCO|nr:hypothetical protein H5410_022608 [Solanum commersonii]
MMTSWFVMVLERSRYLNHCNYNLSLYTLTYDLLTYFDLTALPSPFFLITFAWLIGMNPFYRVVVDAWWSDGWWEGVIAGFDVYGSGEKILLKIQRKNVRTSSDWVYEIWFEVKGKKDLKSFISSSLIYVPKCSIKERENCKNQIAHKLVTLMLLGLKILSKVKGTTIKGPSSINATTLGIT